jgi:hypothetical protein
MGAVVIGVAFLAGTFALYGCLRVVLLMSHPSRPRHGTTPQTHPLQEDTAARCERTLPTPQAPALNGQPAAAGARARRFDRRS